MPISKKNISFLKKCKICGNKNLQKVISIKEQFLSATFIKSNYKNSLKNIRTPLTLVLCKSKNGSKSCGHLQLYEIIKPDLLYRKYFYRSATSKTMQNDLKDVVNKSLNIVKPTKNDFIVDIGSNDNTLLNFYSTELNLVGFEPARNIIPIKSKKKINVINNYFNSKDFFKNFNKKAKIITSCAMFYDLQNPKKFVKDIVKILDDDGLWCVQISYLLSMIKNMNFYDICHEHLSYYSIKSFEKLIHPLGLKIVDLETNEVNGGSIRLYVCKKSCKKYDRIKNKLKIKNLKKKEDKNKLENKDTYYKFEEKINNFKKLTKNYIDKIISLGGSVFGLGASTKGNILLQHFELNKKQIPYISERNKLKIGLKCIGTDIELISEKKARSLKPNAMLVLPWYFKKEIVKRENNYLKKGGVLIFPMPYPHVVAYNSEKKLS